MRPAIASDRIAATLLVVTLIVWGLIELRQGLHRRAEARNTDDGSLMVVRLAAVAGALLAATATGVRFAAFPYSPVVLVISLLVIWSGIGLRVWSFRTLGHYFTFVVMTSPDQPVITTGPYRFLRHPSYLGIMLILTGVSLTYGNWLSMAAIVLFPLVGFLNRIRVEEAALAATLGARYTTYARGRKRLIPYVW